jgi:two-component system sensor histidine kinase/response regulator
VRIEVEDTGGGIPQDKIGTLFESYQQADSSIKKKFGGTGLGLAITKKFCEMLGIVIGVESEFGKGTLFWLNIPVRADSLALKKSAEGVTVMMSDRQQPAAQDSMAAQAQQATTYHSVLVVDDDELNRTLMEEVFQISGHRVYIARSGQEAIEIAQANLPDVILMDVAMPDMDGFEATQHLRNDPATAGIIVIACSALATEDLQAQAMQAGCDGFIRKPVSPEVLMRKIAEIIAQAKRKI